MARFLKLWMIALAVVLGLGCTAAPDGVEPTTGKVREGLSAAPTNVTATVTTKNPTTVSVAWSDNGDALQIFYTVYRSVDGGAETILTSLSNLRATDPRATEDAAVSAGHSYTYRVTSDGPNGPSDYSAPATATLSAACCTTVTNATTTARNEAAPPSATTGGYGTTVDFFFKFTADPATLASTDTVAFSLACIGSSCGTPPTFSNAPITGDSAVTNGYLATVSTSALNVGSYVMTATPMFTNAMAPSGTPYTQAIPYVVTQAATTVSLSLTTPSTGTTSVFGQPITLTATVGPAGATPGSVQFYDSFNSGTSSAIGTAVSVASGATTAAYTTSSATNSFALGTHSFTAVYTSASSDYAASPTSSPAVALTVGKADTTTTNITSSSSPSTVNGLVGNVVTFGATVTASSPGAINPSALTPVDGTVHFDFGDGSSTNPDPAVGSTVTHTYTAATTASASPGYAVTARYMGGTNYNASATAATYSQVVVSDGTMLTLASAATSAVYGSDNTFTATVLSGTAQNADDFSTTSTVDFYSNDGTGAKAIAKGCPVGNQTTDTTTLKKSVTATSTDSNCTLRLSPPNATPVSSLPGLASGSSYVITATYNPDAGHNTANGTLMGGFTITRQTPVVTASSLQNASTFGQAVTLKAVVTQNAGIGPLAPTGTVTFIDTTTSTTLGTTTALAGTSASSTISAASPTQTYALTTANLVSLYALAAGHVITATYNPLTADYNYASTITSGAANITQVVNKSATKTVEISSSNPGVVGVPVTFTINVAAVTPGVDLNGNSMSTTVTTAPTVTLMDGMNALGTATFGTNETWTYTTSALSVGDHTITATYNPNNNFTTSTVSIPQHIDATGTPASIVSSQNPSLYGAAVTFTATLAATTGGVPTGTVTFKDGFGTSLSDLATVALTSANGNAVATYTTSSLSGGLHGIGFIYNGDTNHVAGGNASLAQTITLAPTTTTLAVSPNPAVAGQTLTLSANVTSSAPGVLGGSIVFKDEGAVIATVPVSNGAATATLASITAGTHSITANYQGDTNFDVSTGTVSETVTKAPTVLALSSSSNPSVPNNDVTFTAVITPAAATGSVAFTDGAQSLGSATIGAGGIATIRTAALGDGPHAIHATYAETANYGTSTASLTEIISSTAATLAVTSSPNPSTFGQAITIVAAVGATTGVPSGSVSFATAAGPLGSASIDAQGNATLTTTTLLIGTTTITAGYSGDSFYPAGTGSTTQVVNKGATTVTLTASENPANVGTTVVFTATVGSDAEGLTGSVDFLDGSTVLGNVVLNGAVATFSSSTLAAGAHSITAQYKGDTNFDASASSALVETIAAPSTGPAPSAGSDGGTTAPIADAGVTKTVTVGSDSSSGCNESNGTGSFASIALAALGLAMVRRRRRVTSGGGAS